MRRFTIRIRDDAFAVLQRQALEQRRDIGDQAAVLLEERLRPARRRIEEEHRLPAAEGALVPVGGA